MKIGIFGYIRPIYDRTSEHCRSALPMFDKLVIAVAVSKLKHASKEISKRVEDIKAVSRKECSELVKMRRMHLRVIAWRVVSYDDLTIDLAHHDGNWVFWFVASRSARGFRVRKSKADINKQLGGVETILLFLTQNTAASAQRWLGIEILRKK